jgi:hypothetical protein
VVFKPRGGIWGGIVGLLLGGVGFGLAIWAVNFSLVAPDEQTLRWFLLVPAYGLAGFFVYLLLGAFNLRYRAGDDGLSIRWATRRITVPWNQVRRVVRVTGRKNLGALTGMSWPGYIVGTYTLRGVALVKMYGTQPKGEVVVVETDRGNFGLTPADADRFVIEVLRRSGAELEEVNADEMPEEVRGKILGEDIIYMGLYALNLVLLLGVIAYQAVFFPGSGASRIYVLFIALGMGVLAFNIGNASRVYQFMPSAAYLVWILSFFVMATFLVFSIYGIAP